MPLFATCKLLMLTLRRSAVETVSLYSSRSGMLPGLSASLSSRCCPSERHSGEACSRNHLFGSKVFRHSGEREATSWTATSLEAFLGRQPKGPHYHTEPFGKPRPIPETAEEFRMIPSSLSLQTGISR